MNSGAEVKTSQTPDMQQPIVTKNEDEKSRISKGGPYRTLRQMMKRKKQRKANSMNMFSGILKIRSWFWINAFCLVMLGLLAIGAVISGGTAF